MIFSFADKKGWVLLCHASADPNKWEKICAKYKNASFIVAHAVGTDGRNPAVFKLAELARRCKNLYLDCAASGMTPGILKKLTAVAGAEQITFGSDYPMFDFAYEAGRVIASSLSEKEKDLILYGNAKRLLRL